MMTKNFASYNNLALEDREEICKEKLTWYFGLQEKILEVFLTLIFGADMGISSLIIMGFLIRFLLTFVIL